MLKEYENQIKEVESSPDPQINAITDESKAAVPVLNEKTNEEEPPTITTGNEKDSQGLISASQEPYGSSIDPDSQELSQSTTFSTSSEGIAVKREIDKTLNMKNLNILNEILDVKMRPLRIENPTESAVEEIIKALAKLINIVASPETVEEVMTIRLLQKILETALGLPDGHIQFSCNIFQSLREYCSILMKDSSRSGVVGRKIVCEAVAGEKLKKSRQLLKIHEQFGLGRNLIYESVKQRMRIVDGSTLTPLLEKLHESHQLVRNISAKIG